MLQARPILHKDIEELYKILPNQSTMVVVDLGCSSGPNGYCSRGDEQGSSNRLERIGGSASLSCLRGGAVLPE
jgi:hypothetical protein